ncbi:MAG: SDR family NAD(P)-dependent oxidoreductase [Rickettsiales bacterium]
MTNSTSKHAFVTGGAIRVGRAIALHLAVKGWDITLHYGHSETEAGRTANDIEGLGRSAHLVQADLSIPDAVSGLLENLSKPVSLLIHNASVFEKDSVVTLTADRLQNHLNVNLVSPLLLTQAFVKQLPKDAKGHVICLLDGMLGWSISPHYLSYSISKLGLHNAVNLLAGSLAPGVRINGIALGATLPGDSDLPSTFEKIRGFTPLRSNSNTGEVCAAIDFLLETPSITGHIIDLSSGMALPHLYATE